VKKVIGFITAIGMIVWGLVRSTDERLLLGQESHSGSLGVQLAGLALAAAGVITLIVHWPRRSTVNATHEVLRASTPDVDRR
jgi:uncharacterized membrane protein